ncbi:hypothetical protein ACU4GR_22735 [Methylobacterium oryzae CBMB20]
MGEAVAAALRDNRARPFRLDGPLEIRVRAQTPALADLFCLWPTLRRGGQ